jgi:transposase-like protein
MICSPIGRQIKNKTSGYLLGSIYQQVYQWVKKHEDGGDEALRDKRGKNKVESELSPEEKVKLEMRKLEKENERLRAENEFLKKLEEIERRRR